MFRCLVVCLLGGAAAIGGLQEAGYSGDQGHWVDVTMSSDGSKAAVTAGTGAESYDKVLFSSDADATWTLTTELANLVAMSGDGSKMIAVRNNPSADYKIRLSMDDGATWADTGSPSLPWTCFALNMDGTKMLAAVSGGNIYRSSDSGTTWIDTQTGGQQWEAIAMSADGNTVAIATNDGKIWMSTSGGADILEVADSPSTKWRDIAMTPDGSKIVGATQQNGIWVSTSPTSWVQIASADSKVYRAIDISDDGMTIVASNGISGENWISRDGGTVDSMAFIQWRLNRDWTKIALSGSGDKVISVAGGDGGRIFVGKATTTTVVTSTMTNTTTATTMTTVTTTSETETMTSTTSSTGAETTAGTTGTTSAPEPGSVVEITLTLTVDDPTTITENEAVKTAMVQGFAAATGVDQSQVTLSFQVSRRLSASRMLQVQLTAIFSVRYASAQAAQQAISTTEAVSVDQINTAITTAVAAVPGFTGTVQVTGKEVAIATTTTTAAEEPTSSAQSQNFALVLLAALVLPIF